MTFALFVKFVVILKDIQMKKELIKVLMVEDDLVYARFIKEILKEPLQVNFELTHADRVKHALDHIDAKDFDAVLLDLNLPDSTGFDTLNRIYEKAPSTPIIVLTGLADEEVGVSAVQKGAQDYLSKEEVTSLLLSRTVKYAIERKRSVEELKNSYQKFYNLSARLQYLREEERKSIASEIHDELGGLFTALKLELSSSFNALKTDKADIPEIKDSLIKLIDKGIEIVQRISVELRPHILDHFGLLPAIEWYVKEFQKRAKIRCSIKLIEDNLPIDKDRALAIFRILQESLTNIARHARASKVLVEVRKDGESLDIKVEDNGKGIDEAKINDPKSFGLMSMQERMLYLGGTLKIIGTKGKGTTIIMNIPIGGKGETE